MKFRDLFFCVVVFIFMVVGFVYLYEQKFLVEKYSDAVKVQLEAQGFFRAKRAEMFFEDVERDLSFLVETEEIKDFFQKDLFDEVKSVENSLKERTKERIGRLNALVKESKISISEYNESLEFVDEVLREFDEDGYGVFIDTEFVTLIHPDFLVEGISYEELRVLSPDLVEILSEIPTENGGSSAGFYTWFDDGKKIKNKYIYCEFSEVLQGSLCLMNFVENYDAKLKFANIFGNELKFFEREKEYKNLILINTEGEIIWNDVGGTLTPQLLKENLRSRRVFLKVFDELKYSFKEDFYYFIHELDNESYTSNFYVAVKVYDELEEFLGVLALQIDDKFLKRMIKSEHGDLDLKLFFVSLNNGKFVSDLEIERGFVQNIFNQFERGKLVFDEVEQSFVDVYGGNRFFYINEISDSNIALVGTVEKESLNEFFKLQDENIINEFWGWTLGVLILGFVFFTYVDREYLLLNVKSVKKKAFYRGEKKRRKVRRK